ncbi:MAG: trypsin-like peptidase domain-containing protein [candidate division Zixibacteria bacterium]|nr:trypsin-like peptidase domain-containing protein [candidate division Zixibacteria bacterium]
MNRRKSIALIFLVAFLGAVFGSLFTFALLKPEGGGRYDALPSAAGKAQLFLASDEEPFQKDVPESRRNAIVRAAEKVGPAVVSIAVTQTRLVRSSPYFNPFGADDFDDIWGFFFRPREFKQRVHSIGSGVITDPDGYILTNQHVVEGAEEIRITLPSGEEYMAGVRGEDPTSDLAVLKIGGENLPTAKLGNSDELVIGEWAIAFGNPFGYLLDDPHPTVTAGVISALGRDFKRPIGQGSRVYRKMIQTDAAINPGNSGGPLVNADGEVIGINTFIFTSSRGSEGVGFAIPVNRARRVMEDLIAYGETVPPWVGLDVQSLTPLLAQSLNIDQKEGALVSGVEKNSPAARAGLMRGDVITEVEGKKIASAGDWEDFLWDVRSGRSFGVLFARKNELRKAVLTAQLAAAGRRGPEGKLGIYVADLMPEEAERLGIEPGRGVVVSEVKPNSTAGLIGVEQGDVILEVNKTEVSSALEYERVMKRLKKGQKVVLLLARRGELFYVTTQV